MQIIQTPRLGPIPSPNSTNLEAKRILLSANCSQNLYPLKQKKIRSQSMSLSLKKNIIRINKNKFPSDFFGSRKPEIVSASLPKRPTKELANSPLKYKLSMKQIETNAYSGYQKTEEEEGDEDLMRLTSCFGNPIQKDIQFGKNSEDEKNYYSEQYVKPSSIQKKIVRKELSRESKQSKTGRKAPFFGNNKVAKNKELHLPELNVSPLRKEIQKSRKLSEDNLNDLQFRKKVRALINNSSIAPKTKPMYNLNSDRPKYTRIQSDLTQDLCESEILTITFFNTEKNRLRF